MKVMNGMRGNRQLTSDHEVLAAIRARGLDYPVATKAEFVAAMSRPATPVAFRGRVYVAEFGANLVPDFFFPVRSEQDLLGKLSELLMARGLMPMDGEAVPPSDDGLAGAVASTSSSPQPVPSAIARVLEEVESHLCRPARGGRLDREAVEALDVVTHALVFAGHPHGLDLWRDALWERRLSEGAREAVVRMLEYLTDAVARGRSDEVSQICDCLYLFVPAAAANMSAEESHDAR